MEIRAIEPNKTRLKFNNKTESFLIEQCKFFGSKPSKESKSYTYFEFNADFATTSKYLGMR